MPERVVVIPPDATHIEFAGDRYKIRNRQFAITMTKSTIGEELSYFSLRLTGCPEGSTPSGEHEPGMF